MKIPQLRKQEEKKTSHGYVWEDNYSWVHQSNCLEILQDKNKLNPEVKKYLEEENTFTEKNMEDTKSLQKELFKEIEGRIKLEDESLKFKDKLYEYWTKTTKEGKLCKAFKKKIRQQQKLKLIGMEILRPKGKNFLAQGILLFQIMMNCLGILLTIKEVNTLQYI